MGGEYSNLIMLVLMGLVFYFFFIAPSLRKQKREKKFSSELKKGDRVVTKSGMHGKVADFSEKLNTVIIETGAGKITFDRSSISLELTKQLNDRLSPKVEKK